MWTFLLDPYMRAFNIELDDAEGQYEQMAKWATDDSGVQRNLIAEMHSFVQGGSRWSQSLKRIERGVKEAAAARSFMFFDLRECNSAPTYQETKFIVNMATEEGHIDGVLNWWSSNHGKSLLYKHVAKSLLSLSTVGSITVERAAKPLKIKVWTKGRNKMLAERACMLLRTGLNLRLLRNVHRKLLENAARALVAGDRVGTSVPQIRSLHARQVESK